MSTKKIILSLLLLYGTFVQAQDIERMIESPIFNIGTGFANCNATFLSNETAGAMFNYMLSGGYTPELFGIAIPLSFTFCDRDLSFSNPLNTFKISPTYKGYTLNIGTNAMTFSPYTLAGHQFTGLSAEIAPLKSRFKGSFIFGKMNLANLTMVDNASKIDRRTYGFNIEHKTEKYHFATSLLKVFDRETSLVSTPKDNASLSLSLKYFFTKKLYFSGDWANSAITDDTRAESYKKTVSLNNPMLLLVKNNLSTSVAQAYKLQLGYGFYSVSFEKVDPNYRTLGAYYSNNNFYNFTLNASHQFKKISVSGRFGLHQRTVGEQSAKTQQFVGSINLMYMPKQGTFISTVYSNFQTYSYVRDYIKESEIIDPYNFVDTLAYSCINQSADVSFSHTLQRDNRTIGNINAFLSMQQIDINNKIYLCSANFSAIPKQGSIYGINMQANYQTELHAAALGVGLHYGDRFFKNKITWRVSLNQNTYIMSEKVSKVAVTCRANLAYSINKHHKFQIQMSNLISTHYNFMLNAGYSWSF